MKILKGSRQFAVASLTVLVVLLTSLSWALADASPPLEEWSTTFGGSYNDIGYSVQVTSDGGYIITGSMQSVWDGLEVYLVKVDSHGVEEWSTTFGGYNWDMGYSVQETSDGGYIITGETNSFGDFSLDVYLVKTNSQGVEEWTTTFGGSNVDRGYSVQVTSDGGYIITGETRSFGAGGSDVYLVKTDFQGRMEWNRTFGGSSTEAGRSVQETSDGGYIIAGETSSFGTGGIDVYLVKVDSRGEEEWSTTFGGSDDDIGRSVQVTSDGGYIITGSTYSFGAVWFDVYLVKADSQGGEEWSMTFGGSEDDGGRSVQETSDGGYIIAGETSSFGTGGIDVYLVKVDSQGREREPEPGQNGGLAPVASFTVDPGVALVGQNLVFDASDSYDPDGSISTYSWDYGDGETGEGASTLHVYEEAGEYLVALTVVDDSGATDTVSLVLDVQVFNARIIDTSPPFEEWSMTFGGSEDDGGESVQKASDGGYIIVGYTYSLGAGLSDVYLVKTDSQGVEEWSRTFGGSSWDEGYSVRETSDGGYIIVGETRSFGSGDTDVYLVKTDSQGAEEWSNTFGGSESDGGESVQETSDGGYIITGHTYSFFTGRLRLYLIKTDSQGVEEWSTTFGSTSDAGYSIQETSDGGYIIAGYTGFSGGLYKNASLLKTTSQGGQEWSATLGGINREEGRSVQETSDGGYILTGYTSSFGAGGSDVYLVKTNSRGVEEWSTTLGDYLGEIGESVLETSDGGYLIAGYTNSFSAGLSDVYLVKTDSLGGEVWSITFGGYAEDLGYSVQETSDGGYIITGKTKSFGAGGYDVYLVKVGLQGDTSSPEPEPEPSPSPDPTPEPTQTPEPSPSPEPTPEPTPEPEQGGIPGFPTLAIVIGVFLSLFILKKIQS